MSEREKMLAGEPYDALDPELVEARAVAIARLMAFNNEPDEAVRSVMLEELLGSIGPQSAVVPPLHCDYGAHVHLGTDCFVNAGAVFLDCGEITIGDRSQLGPGVQLLAADHPIEPEKRLGDVEFSQPISIGENCWIGGGAIVCPGVSIGDHSVIGAGSVVTRDVPSRVVAAGSPCRVIRQL